MLTGRIFEEITGRRVSEFKTTTDIWSSVAASRPTTTSCNEYGAGVVSKRGGVFKIRHHDFDIDQLIEAL